MKQEMSPERGKIKKIHRKPHDAPLSLDQMNRMPGHEEKAKRTRSSKVYSLGRGLYQAVMYPEAVHAKDQDGNWCEIDNTLLEKQDEKGLFFQNKMNPRVGKQRRSSKWWRFFLLWGRTPYIQKSMTTKNCQNWGCLYSMTPKFGSSTIKNRSKIF